MTALAPRARRRRTRRGPRAAFAVLLAAVVIGIPAWLVAATIGKSSADAQSPNLHPPKQWHAAANLHTAFNQGQMARGLLNTVLVVVPSVILVLILAAMAAWIFARRAGRLTAVVYAVSISGIVLPPTVITMVLELRKMGLADTRVGLICAYTGIYLSFAIFFMTGFIKGLPIELEEAAGIDGAGPMRVFWSIVFPLLRPVIATAAIMVTLFAWNDIFYAFFVLGGGGDATLPLNLYQVANAQLYQNNWNLIFAFISIMSLPLVALFMLGQRRIISGITSGAVK
ncbi:MAG: raffinose/stachyose/melibiose transport system permease protein [Frankiales bacterium]|jgi:raffinose/stachyose/melibiose transport system permease protein|nr:raffinose/stachyose/melibiose transport system permease protein [Frankiales bacterium]